MRACSISAIFLLAFVSAIGDEPLRPFQEYSTYPVPFGRPRFLGMTPTGGGFLVTEQNFESYVHVLDDTGQITRSLPFVGTYLEGGNVLSDGSIVLCGDDHPRNQPSRAVAVWLDSEGKEQKRVGFHGRTQQGSSECFWNVQPRVNGGLILTGGSTSPPGNDKESPLHGGWDGWVVALREDGSKEWDRSYGDVDYDLLQWGFEEPDGSLVFGGSRSNKSFDYRIWLFKTDKQGTNLWEHLEPGLMDACIRVKDGDYVFSGNGSISRIGTDGSIRWRKSWRDLRNSGASWPYYGLYSVHELADQRLLVLVTRQQYPVSTQTIQCLDKNGNLLWETRGIPTLDSTTGPLLFGRDSGDMIMVASRREDIPSIALTAGDSVPASPGGVFCFPLPEFQPTPKGEIAFSLVGEAGRSYVVQKSYNLQDWFPHSTNTIASRDVKFLDQPSPLNGHAYFRAQLLE